MPNVSFSLEDIKQLLDERFIIEREYTRQLVREEVQGQFRGFIEHTFQPFIDHVEERFDRLEDRVDYLARDVTELKIENRHIKQVLKA